MKWFGLVLFSLLLFPALAQEGGGGGGICVEGCGGGAGYDICMIDSTEVFVDSRKIEDAAPGSTIEVEGELYTVPCEKTFEITSPCHDIMSECQDNIFVMNELCSKEIDNKSILGFLFGTVAGVVICYAFYPKKNAEVKTNA